MTARYKGHGTFLEQRLVRWAKLKEMEAPKDIMEGAQRLIAMSLDDLDDKEGMKILHGQGVEALIKHVNQKNKN